MMLPEAIDGHVRFSIDIDDRTRHVFVPYAMIETDSGVSVSRADVVEYVLTHLARYTEKARQAAIEKPVGLATIIVLEQDTQSLRGDG